jgi:quercetin dioxygenase-like cupin family protein
MGVTVIDLSARDWQGVPATWGGKVASGEPDVRFKSFTIESGAVPAGQLIEFEPGHVEAEHSHDESELFYMLAGDLQIEDTTVGPGALVYVPGGTRYSNRTQGGCSFLRLGLRD